MDVRTDKDRVSRLADRQFGRVGRYQLAEREIGRGQIDNWLTNGYLIWVLPCVFAVGHQAPSIEADLAAAVLYAGPGAMLDGATAAWWLGLIDRLERPLTIATPRKCLSLPGITIHGRRPHERE